MTYDFSVNYAQKTPVSDKAKCLGATVLGGLAGMTCYYLPVGKDTFVNAAYSVTKENAKEDIEALKVAAKEISDNKLSTESKLLLNKLGVSEALDAIKDKTKALHDSITDPDLVKNLKKSFADNFKSYKKDASKMDAVTSKAMSNIKWNGFRWGMLIGALLGGAISLIAIKDRT